MLSAVRRMRKKRTLRTLWISAGLVPGMRADQLGFDTSQSTMREYSLCPGYLHRSLCAMLSSTCRSPAAHLLHVCCMAVNDYCCMAVNDYC